MTETVGTNEPWQIKEALVRIPLLASALAIIYDVSYFFGMDIKLFSLFSLTEHLGFALEALPSAMILVTVGLLVAWLRKETGGIPFKTQRSRLLYFIVWATVLIALGLYFGTIAMMLFGLCVGYGFHERARMDFNREQLVFIYIGLIVFATFAIGFDRGRMYLRYGEATHLLQTENEMLPIKIIASGDRGLLYVDVKSNQLLLARWDSVKKLGKQLPTESHLRWLLHRP